MVRVSHDHWLSCHCPCRSTWRRSSPAAAGCVCRRPLQLLEFQASRDGDPLCASEHQADVGLWICPWSCQAACSGNRDVTTLDVELADVDLNVAHKRLVTKRDAVAGRPRSKQRRQAPESAKCHCHGACSQRRTLGMQIEAIGGPIISHMQPSTSQCDVKAAIGKRRGLRRLGRGRCGVGWLR